MTGITGRVAALAALAFSVGVFTGCGGASAPDLCAKVECPQGQSCNAADGTCKAATPAPGACSPACSGTTPVCDAPSSVCKACTATAGCTGTMPVCDELAHNGQGACAVCTATAGCGGARPHCDLGVTGGRCVECTTNASCTGSDRPSCDVPHGDCVGCLETAQCSGATPVCDFGLKRCVADAVDGGEDDGGIVDGGDGDGGLPDGGPITVPDGGHFLSDGGMIPGDTCATAIPITVSAGADGGSTVFIADTSQASNDYNGSCNAGTASPELVYSFTLAANQDVRVRAERPSGNSLVDPVLYLRAGVCAPSPETDLACSDHPSSSAVEEVFLHDQPAGTYFVFVEAYGNSSAGPTQVTVTLTNPTPPPPPAPNDTCTGAIDLSFDAGTADGGLFTAFTVDTSPPGAHDDYAGTCVNSANSGPDVVYHLNLATASDLKVSSHASDGGTADPVIFLRHGPCASGVELACDDKINPTAEILSLRNLAAGDYYLFVDSYGAAGAGPTDVTVQVTGPTPAPPNDSCTSPEALTFAANVATTTGDTTNANNDNTSAQASPSCSSSARSTGQDLVYTYTLATAQDVQITVTPTGASPKFHPAVYVRKDGACASGGLADQLACQTDFTSGPQVIKLVNQPAGTYSLWVDGTTGTFGPFSLEVRLTTPTPPPPNDVCATAQLLPSTGGSVTGTTAGGTSDVAGSCGSTAPDVAYTLTTTAAADLELTVTPTPGASSFRPAVTLVGSNGCAALSQPLACNYGFTTGSTAHLTARNVPAGTYIVWVDGATATDSGAFTLNVAVKPATPPPANDTCLAPAPLFADGGSSSVVAGDLTQSFSQYSGSCVPFNGGDLVYAFTTTAEQKLDVKVTPTAPGDAGLLWPAVYLREAGACLADAGFAARDGGFSNAPGCASAPAQGSEGHLVVSALPPGAYLLVVEGNPAHLGPFNVEAKLASVDPVPANDSCSAPRALDVSTGTALLVDDTRDAGDDHNTGACNLAGSASGPDLVYRFTTPAIGGADGGVSARVMAYSNNAYEFVPSLTLDSACGPGAELDCQNVSVNSTSSQAVVFGDGLAPASDYFVWVDSAPGTLKSGPFTLQVDVAVTPANDLCSAAAVLQANVSTPGSTLAANDDLDSNNGTTCVDAFPGRDVVYVYTPTTSGPVTVTVVPERGFDPGIAVLTSCLPSSCIASADVVSSSQPESVTFNATAGTPYYLVVDSYSASGRTFRGGFVISVQ